MCSVHVHVYNQEFIVYKLMEESIEGSYGLLEYCFQSNMTFSLAHVITIMRVLEKKKAIIHQQVRYITVLFMLETPTEVVSILAGFFCKEINQRVIWVFDTFFLFYYK